MQKIIRRRIINAPNQLPNSIDPVLARVYSGRGITKPEEIACSFRHLHPYRALSGMDAATRLLADALTKEERIVIVADFDADGATSCATAVRALRMMGAAANTINFIVPNRFQYGYGLTPPIVAVAAELNPQLLVTVDNGISSIDGVAAAKARGIKVLVTDHHLPGEFLPDADAIVNPNQPGDRFPSKSLAGVGVVFYVMLALRAHLRELGWFSGARTEPNLAQLLDLVALGTIADVVPLDQCNRILVAQGLERIRRGLACEGIQALAAVSGRDTARMSASDLGFAVGPRLNAAGRLEDMTVGIECLLADSSARARDLAVTLDELNRNRREIEATMRDQAMAHLDRQWEKLGGQLPAGVSLFDPTWHQGVIGLVAGRVKERFHRPCVAFAKSEGGELKGSARSVPGLNIRDVLESVDTRHPGLILKFGGHAMAAGLSLVPDGFTRFTAAFDAQVRAMIDADTLQGVVYTDGELSAEQLSVHVAQTLRDGGPWGQGFPEPVFDGEFDVVEYRVVGERHVKMAVRPTSSNRTVDAIAFNAVGEAWSRGPRRLRLAYRLDINEFRGNRSAQLVVEHAQST